MSPSRSKAELAQANRIPGASTSLTTLCFTHGVELAVYTERLRLSPFFETLLNSNNTSGRIRIPGSDPNLSPYNLKNYIHFLYTSNLATQMAGTEDDFAFLRDECKLLGELYYLGIFVEDPRFRNAILDEILEISRLKGKNGISYLPDPGIFFDLPHDSPAKRCVMDLYIHFLDPDDPAIDLPQNQQFMREVFKAFMRRSDVKSEHGHFRRHELKRCDYHEHPNSVRCDG